MSDFDREAEREKLEEKYGDDDRNATEQMSELLLQGATMTNRHCDDCGDPIFRYDGQEFCPTCQAETGESGQTPDQDQDREQTTDQDQRTQHQESGDETTRTPTPRETTDATANGDRTAPEREERRPVETPTESQGGVAEAQRSIERTLAKFARQAEQSDDPRTAREHLQTAREAAEALSALRR